MTYETLLVDMKDSVGTLTLNRPDRLNAMSEEMYREMQRALDEIFNSPGIRALVLTGAGRAFCAGADLKTRELDRRPGEVEEPEEILFELANPVFKLLRNAPTPTVAAVNGACAGAGVSLALSCDFVIAARSSFFLQAYINLGIGPDMGSSWFLQRSVGTARAFELMTLGERLPAAKAEEWGLIHRCVDDANLIAETASLAQKLAQGPTQGYLSVRNLTRAACANDLETQVELERQHYFKDKTTEDAREAQRAYSEGRAPRFAGK